MKQLFNLLFVLVLLFPSLLFASSKKKNKTVENINVEGRWTEYKRTDLSKNVITFTDTLKVYGIKDNEMSLYLGGFTYIAKIENNVADFFYKTLSIVTINKDELVFKDEEYIYYFLEEKVDQIYVNQVVDGMEGIQKILDVEVDKIDLDLLDGAWRVFKRENRKGPSDDIDVSLLMDVFSFNKELKIAEINKNYKHGAEFEVEFVDKSRMVLRNKEEARSYLVRILTERELVLESAEGLIFHFRKRE